MAFYEEKKNIRLKRVASSHKKQKRKRGDYLSLYRYIHLILQKKKHGTY